MEGLQLAAKAEDTSTVVMFLGYNFTQLAAAEGSHERALRLYGAVTALRRLSGTNHVFLSVELVSIVGDLPEETIQALIAEGEAMELKDVVAYALQE